MLGGIDVKEQAIQNFKKCIHALSPCAVNWEFKDTKAKSLPQGVNSFVVKKGRKKNGDIVFSECDN